MPESTSMEIHILNEPRLCKLSSGISNGQIHPADMPVNQRIVPGDADCLLPCITWIGPDDMVGCKLAAFTIPYKVPDNVVLENWQVEGECTN
jgi:hypothetical protein